MAGCDGYVEVGSGDGWVMGSDRFLGIASDIGAV